MQREKPIAQKQHPKAESRGSSGEQVEQRSAGTAAESRAGNGCRTVASCPTRRGMGRLCDCPNALRHIPKHGDDDDFLALHTSSPRV